MTESMSRDELLRLPAITDLATACRALGVGGRKGYEMARSSTFPVKVVRIGGSWRVPTAGIFALLGIDPGEFSHSGAPRSDSAGGSGSRPGVVPASDDADRSDPAVLAIEDALRTDYGIPPDLLREVAIAAVITCRRIDRNGRSVTRNELASKIAAIRNAFIGLNVAETSGWAEAEVVAARHEVWEAIDSAAAPEARATSRATCNCPRLMPEPPGGFVRVRHVEGCGGAG
jgi:hypothetical protein